MIAYDRLSQIVPSDQALAAKAMSVALQQISGITNMTLPVLANVVVGQQTTNNLTLIANLTQAVPTSVSTYLSNIGGANGRPVGVCDVLGIAAGYQVTNGFQKHSVHSGQYQCQHADNHISDHEQRGHWHLR